MTRGGLASLPALTLLFDLRRRKTFTASLLIYLLPPSFQLISWMLRPTFRRRPWQKASLDKSTDGWWVCFAKQEQRTGDLRIFDLDTRLDIDIFYLPAWDILSAWDRPCRLTSDRRPILLRSTNPTTERTWHLNAWGHIPGHPNYTPLPGWNPQSRLDTLTAHLELTTRTVGGIKKLDCENMSNIKHVNYRHFNVVE